MHLLSTRLVDVIAVGTATLAEMVGFEPTDVVSINGFQDRHHKPLGHISIGANSEIRTHSLQITNQLRYLCAMLASYFMQSLTIRRYNSGSSSRKLSHK